MNNVFAILVTYNPDEKVFDKVLSSISSQVPIIIIDNASKNHDFICELSKKHSNIELSFLKSNIGLASAQNIAIGIAKKNMASHVLFFDQDSIIENEFVNNLISAEEALLQSGVSVGAVGPGFYDPDNNMMYPATVYKGLFIKRVSLDKQPIEASFVIASGCLIRMSVLDDVGLMKDELFIDYIDIEWSLRAKALGYPVFVVPSAKMAHTIGEKRISIFGRPISIHSPIRRYFMLRNSFFMMKLPYVPLGYKLREVVFNFARFALGFIFSNDKVVYLQYAIKGITDGIKGRYGAY